MLGGLSHIPYLYYITNRYTMNTSSLNLRLNEYELMPFESSKWDEDYYVVKVSESKTHYTMLVSNDNHLIRSWKKSLHAYTSSIEIKINRNIKRNGMVLVSFITKGEAYWKWDCDEINVLPSDIDTPNKFITLTEKIMDRLTDIISINHNKWVEWELEKKAKK